MKELTYPELQREMLKAFALEIIKKKKKKNTLLALFLYKPVFLLIHVPNAHCIPLFPSVWLKKATFSKKAK